MVGNDYESNVSEGKNSLLRSLNVAAGPRRENRIEKRKGRGGE
jgi:hypothetical protein